MKDALAFAGVDLKSFKLNEFEIDNDLAQKSIAEDLIEDYNDLNSQETKEARTKHFGISGVKPGDYSERVIELGNGKKAICGIRHEGANPNYPFIQVIPDFELRPSDCQQLYDGHLKNYFSMFDPLHIRFWSNEYREDCLTGSTFLVSSMTDLKRVNEWDSEKSITFGDVTDNSYYPWYESLYKEFHKNNPDLENRVTVNSSGTMESSVKDGLLKYVLRDGAKVGLIAAVRSKFLGHKGIYFNEILLSKEHKGKGLAKAIQRKFLNQYAEPNDFIWGTIDYQNRPSYKTALSNGRRPIRFETFVPITSREMR